MELWTRPKPHSTVLIATTAVDRMNACHVIIKTWIICNKQLLFGILLTHHKQNIIHFHIPPIHCKDQLSWLRQQIIQHSRFYLRNAEHFNEKMNNFTSSRSTPLTTRTTFYQLPTQNKRGLNPYRPSSPID